MSVYGETKFRIKCSTETAVCTQKVGAREETILKHCSGLESRNVREKKHSNIKLETLKTFLQTTVRDCCYVIRWLSGGLRMLEYLY